MPTVKQVLKEVAPAGARMVAGEAGQYGEVSWVVTLRPSPPGFDSLKGGEFAIVGAGVASGLGISLSRLVVTLAQRRVSAIAVMGDVPADAREEAHSIGLPLIHLPAQTNISSLEAGITRLVDEERQRLYQQERELSQLLMELAVAGGGAAAIIDKLKELTGRELGFIDLNLRPHFPLPPEIKDYLPGTLRMAVAGLRYPASAAAPVAGVALTPELYGLIGPIRVGKETKGYLMLVAAQSQISEADRLAVRVGTLALAVEMSRRQAVEETEGRFEGDIIDALIVGDFSAEAVSEKAKKLGIDLARAYAAMIVRFEGSSPDKAAALHKVASLLPGSLSHYREDDLVVVAPVKPLTTAELRRLGEKFAADMIKYSGKSVTLGMGRAYSGPEGIRLSYQEAEQAIGMGLKLFGAGSATFFGDLGVYRLLFSLKSGEELKAFHEDYLGKLAEYDRKHEGELIQTLEAYLRYKTAADTARALHVHRNTLLYRLERIKEITGLDIEDGETRLAVHLAILAAETMRVG